MSLPIYRRVLEYCIEMGVQEFCVCPGSRNSPLIRCLTQSPHLTKYFWFEERSAAFFALGRTRQTKRPVCVVTTSGTAVAELLPAVMEAYYTAHPLLLLTADRPRRFRGTGAPQSAEQVGIFGIYAPFACDLAGEEECRPWDKTGPAHLNICLEEPKSYPPFTGVLSPAANLPDALPQKIDGAVLESFFQQVHRLFVVVAELNSAERKAACDFLLRLGAPIYCEAASGLREEPSLAHLQIRSEARLWHLSSSSGYDIDGILRIGGIPVARLWRDLEDRQGSLRHCSLSRCNFRGLSWGKHLSGSLEHFLPTYTPNWTTASFADWQSADKARQEQLQKLFERYATSETALCRTLARCIPQGAMVYLGNSLPVREWDLAASFLPRSLDIQVSRGVNGIDGQLSTFLGLCQPGRDNWAIVGDLTALYDFAALWILRALPDISIKIVVINNGGGKIFARLYEDPALQHRHPFDFKHFASSWHIPYFCFKESVPDGLLPQQAFIEMQPNLAATEAFWQAYDA